MRILPLVFFVPVFLMPVLAQQPPPVEHAWQILDRGLHEGNPEKRVQDVIAMGVMRPQAKSVGMVESAFTDKDYSVRQAACGALQQMNSRQSIPKLRDMLNDKAPEVIFAAAKALYAMGDPTGREVLVAIVLGDQADSSNFFASSMHDMKAKMHDPKGLVILGAKAGAGVLLGPASVGIPVTEGLLKDANASGKTIAVALLAKDLQPETTKAIRTALEDKNWTVRAVAARTLALNEKVDAFDQVAALLDDNKDEVTYSAAAAVIRLKQPAAGLRAAPKVTKK